ncbi:MAG: cytochrome c [Elainellaceae cyanobacterium]
MTKELLNERTTPNLDVIIQGLSLALLAALFAALLFLLALYQTRYADPYFRTVLSASGDAERGAAIFQMNCAVCHGLNGDGQVGPSLQNVSERKSKVAIIRQVVSGDTPPMPQFQPNPKDMADLLGYLETL